MTIMLKKAFLLLIVIFSCQLSAVKYTEIPDTCSLQLLTPTFQERKTIKIKLENGLEAFIVSDPKADQSGAALVVRTGSWENPNNALGLAHFVEHMLFMGSKKYPNDDFHKFIQDRGGMSNAYTDALHTAYMFSCNSPAFSDALDRFSHFFIDPLFTEESLKKEIHAVNEEHKKNIEHDAWRMFFLSKLLGNPAHPRNRFGTGTIDTLKRVDHDQMQQWFENHYSANLMTLVICSPLPLEDLKKMIVEDFSAIPDHHLKVMQSNASILSSVTENKVIALQPFQKLNLLRLEFQLPRRFITDPAKPADLLAYALNRGHDHSLQEILKKQGLITSFSVAIESQLDQELTLTANFDLTDKGVRNYPEIIKTFFEAIAWVKEHNIPKSLYDEKNTMGKTNYSYSSRNEVFNSLMQTTFLLTKEPLSSFPEQFVVIPKYSTERNEDLLQNLTLKNCQIFLAADPKLTGYKPKFTAPYYQADYSLEPLSEETLSLLADAAPSETFSLPTQNRFLPSQLTLVKDQADQPRLDHPKKIIDGSHGLIYYAKDDRYHIPKTAAYFALESPLFDPSVEASTKLELLANFIQYHSSALTYEAYSSGISIMPNSSPLHLNISVEGYSDNLDKALAAFIDQLKALPSEQEFEQIKQKMLEDYESTALSMPLRQSIYIMSHLINPETSLDIQKASALRKLDYESFISFCKNAFNQLYIKGTIIGNLTEAQARKLYGVVYNGLDFKPFPTKEHYALKVLEDFKENKIDTLAQSLTNSGSGLVLLVNQDGFTFEKKATQLTLAPALAEAFFTKLRTEENTAYIASGQKKQFDSRLFFQFFLQSGTHSCADLQTKVSAFLSDYVTNFTEKIDEKRFENLKANQKLLIINFPKNLSEHSQFIYTLAFDQKDFNYKSKLLKALDELTYKQFCEMCIKWFSDVNPQKLFISSQGLIDKKNIQVEANMSIEDWMKQAKYLQIEQ